MDQQHRELCQSEGRGTRGYQGMKAGVGYKDKVILGAAKGFGVFWIGGGFKKVFLSPHSVARAKRTGWADGSLIYPVHHRERNAEGGSLCGQEGEMFSEKVSVTLRGLDIVE